MAGRNFKAPASIALLLALLLPSSALGVATSFRLNIFDRAGLLPTARVRVTLELSAAPTAGTDRLTVGSTDINVDSFLTVGGDQVIVAGAGNSVIIDYTPFSLFADPTNLCNGSGGKQVNMIFNGPSVTAYRITTYTAAAPSTASTLNCSTGTKRVSAHQATITDSAGNPTAIPFKGRHPLDMILVLDESGSMSLSAGTGSRWTVLTHAVTTLVDLWKNMDAPMAGSAKEYSGDRIGLVFFTTNATAHTFSGGTFFRTRGTPVATHPWEAVVSAMAGHGPSDMTAIGKGINLAIDKHDDEPPQNDAVFVVMTDGVQNIDPEIVTSPMGTTIQALAPSVGATPVPLHQHGIPMQTIVFGTGPTTNADLLSLVSQQTAGSSVLTATSAGMVDGFMDAMIKSLKGGTFSLAHREKGTINSPAGTTTTIHVDASVERIGFVLSWEAAQTQSPLMLEVFHPGSSVAVIPTLETTRPNSYVGVYDVPATAAGSWTVRLRKRSAYAGNVPYNLSSIFREGRLGYQIDFRRRDTGTGDAMTVEAIVSWDGKPLDGLPANAIEARIRRPNEGMGNILHGTNVDIPGSPPGAPDPDDPYMRKVNHLIATGNLLDRVEPADKGTIFLAGQGNGVYSGTFADTSVPGQYTVDVKFDWVDARTAKIVRREHLERQVKVNADPDETQITSTPGSTPGTYLVSVTPRDRFGNYLGPGGAKRLQLQVAPPAMVAGPPVDPNQTGTYVYSVTNVPPGQRPQVLVATLDDHPLGGIDSGPSVVPGVAPSPGDLRFFLDVGVNFVTGGLGNADGSFSINAGIERFFTPVISGEVIVGYHAFDGGAPPDPEAWQFSLNGKRYFGGGPLRFFANAGGGLYIVDGTGKAGVNAGFGALYDVTSRWGIEGVFNYHNAITSGSNAEFNTVQIGARYAF